MGLLVLASSIAGVGCALSAPTWQGPKSDHFDGEKFHSPGAAESARGLGAFLKWQTSRQRGTWRGYHDEPFGPAPPRRVGAGAMRVTFINHASTLFQLDGVNVLADPIYAERASPFQFAGPERVRPPGIRFEDLPPIDAIVLSHNHYDHMDVATLKRVQAAFPAVRVFAGLGNKAFLESKGLVNVTELDWWQAREVGGITITSVPNQHFSNRGLFDSDGTLWSAWVFQGTQGRAYFAGDTGDGPHFDLVGQKLGPFRVAVLPIGAYKPEWFMGPIHIGPAQAVAAAERLKAQVAVPIHYGTFDLADDGETEPLDELAKAPGKFKVVGFGEGLDVPPLEGATP